MKVPTYIYPLLAILLTTAVGYIMVAGGILTHNSAPLLVTAISATGFFTGVVLDRVLHRRSVRRREQSANLALEAANQAVKRILVTDRRTGRLVEHRNIESALQMVAHTSTVTGGATSVMDTEKALVELRSQLGTLTEQVAKNRNEIVEVQKIDPVLEATLTASIENLTKRIEMLEKKQLEKWDVVLVLIQVLGALGVAMGIAFGVVKNLSGK